MKCDELKVYVPQDGGSPIEEETCYLKSDVDAAIAELKDEIKRLENVRKVHIEGIESMSEGLKLDAEQLRKTQRALWMARAERAHLKVLEYWPDYCHNARCRIAEQKWDKVERKCRAKAEQYL